MFSVTNKQWINWSESFISKPEMILYPKNEQDINNIINYCQKNDKKIRVIGAGHSFTPLAVTNSILLSLEHFSGIDKIDYENKRVSVWAGTTLLELGKLLYEHDLSMENLGDINVQTIAGAISTGTHGSGINFGNLSTQVTELTVITASGDYLTISDTENSHLFNAARLSLGLLGIIIKVKIKVISAHQLISVSKRSTINKSFPILKELTETNRHFEFFWFPHTETIQIKTLNPVLSNFKNNIKGPSTFNDLVIENGALGLVSKLSRMQPKLSKCVSKMIAIGVPTGRTIGNSFEMYATPRLVKFNEMEYSIPAEHMASAIRDINYVIQKYKFDVHFPIECRYVKGDDLWLSPSYERDSAYIAIHMYKGMEYKHFFAKLEEVFRHYQGRPHWGKEHTLTSVDLQNLFPKYNDFLQIRKQLDPNNLFLNHYLAEVFTINDS